MGSRSGGGKIRNLRKVKSGYDQEFTLPKGTSAAPIKQVSLKNTYTNPKSVYMDKQYIKAKQREVGNIEYVFKNGKWVQVN